MSADGKHAASSMASSGQPAAAPSPATARAQALSSAPPAAAAAAASRPAATAALTSPPPPRGKSSRKAKADVKTARQRGNMRGKYMEALHTFPLPVASPPSADGGETAVQAGPSAASSSAAASPPRDTSGAGMGARAGAEVAMGANERLVASHEGGGGSHGGSPDGYSSNPTTADSALNASKSGTRSLPISFPLGSAKMRKAHLVFFELFSPLFSNMVHLSPGEQLCRWQISKTLVDPHFHLSRTDN